MGESGKSNVYSGYKATGEYKVRIKREGIKMQRRDGTTYYKTQYETLRKSTVKKY